MSPALLIIDVQNILCSGQYAAFDIERVVDRINLVSATTRNAGAPVILIQHETSEGAMKYGEQGWKLAKELNVQNGDLKLRKTAPDSFHKTELRSMLQQRDIDQLIICGLQSDFCVDTTTRAALALGYPVSLISDGHSTLDNGVLSASQIVAHHNITLANITSFGPRVTLVTANELRI